MENLEILFTGKTKNGRWIKGTPVYYQNGDVAIFNDSCPQIGYEATRIAEMREQIIPESLRQIKEDDLFETLSETFNPSLLK